MEAIYEKAEDSVAPGPTLSRSKDRLPIIDDLLLIREPPASMSTSRRVPLSTAAAYEELSPLGSAQLERNAIHFFDTPTRDQAAVEEINLKVKSTYDSMPNGWSRLRAHSEESRGTICSHLSISPLRLFRPALCSLLLGLLV